MKYKIILNPYANRWSAGRRLPEIRAGLERMGLAYDLAQSERPGHCEEIARRAALEGCKAIVAAGGDGTVGEVVNGLFSALQSGPAPALGIIPIGTANDLVANLGLGLSLDQSLQRLVSGRTGHIDACMVNGRYFVNNAGLGLEPYITSLQQKMTRLSGIIRYLWATLVGISHNPQWSMSLEWEGGNYAGPVTMVSIGNAPRTGGLFYTVPGADPRDGKLSFIHVSILTRLAILRALPMILKPGKGNITEHPRVSLHHASRLSVRTDRPSPIHADGELFPQWGSEFEFSVHPGKLSVLVD